MKSILGTRVLRAGRWRVLFVFAAIGSSSCTGRDLGGEKRHLGATEAGSASATGPGVPADFAGRIQSTMPVAPDERAAIDQANALAAARAAAARGPLDRGFGAPPRAPGKRGAP